MRHLQTEITIHATPEAVWKVLTDFENFPNWNPFIKSINGNQSVGGKLTVQIQPPDEKSMTFNPTVLVYEPMKELRWIGKGPIPGLFSGEHYFIIEDQLNGSVKFTHGEHFSGILVGFMKKMLDRTEIGFQSMNEVLKKQCEKVN
ncbi:MAG: SRPBCC domain-containing protein [Flavobacteriales bacterium]